MSAGSALVRLLEAAATDGHTVVPVSVAGSLLAGRGFRLEVALREVGHVGSGLVGAPTAWLVGLRALVNAEQSIARAVHERAGSGRLRVVVGPAGVARDEAVVACGPDAAVADDCEYLGVETLATFFNSCADDETVVLAGDVAGLGSPGAGCAFANIAESGVAAVVEVGFDDRAGAVLRDFAAGVAAGASSAIDDPTREVVIVPATTAAEVRHRVVQLVRDSIPRAFGLAPSQIQVLAATTRGEGGAAALAAPLAAIGAPPAMSVGDALGRYWPAVVFAVAPSAAGLLSRPLIYSAITRATRHLSIAQGAGRAFGDAVERVPGRRRTLLTGLLTAAEAPSVPAPPAPGDYPSSSDSHSRSSSSSSSSSSISSSTVSTGPNGVTSSYVENSASS
jgi:exodeoxyribonuclease V alpha subunit